LIAGIITELGVIEPENLSTSNNNNNNNNNNPSNASRNSDAIIPVTHFLSQVVSRYPGLYPALEQRIQVAIAAGINPISTPIGYQRMNTVSTMLEYLVTQSHLTRRLGTNSVDEIVVNEVGDGNLNFVYIISHREHSDQAIVVKQALPYVRCIGESWPLTLERATFEYNALSAQTRYTTSGTETGSRFIPQLYGFDASKAMIIMEFIAPPHLILRKHLIRKTRVTTFARDLGEFVAMTSFRSSALALTGGDLRRAISAWSRNIALCALTEKVIFSDPYHASALNHHTDHPRVHELVTRFQTGDSELKLAIAHFKRLFLTSPEALLHGDLHTGSVMCSEGSTKIIDPEFAFYGPIGFDLGAVLPNLLLAYYSYSVPRSSDSDSDSEYADWILEQIVIFYSTFESTFLSLWNDSLTNNNNTTSFSSSSGEIFLSSVYTTEEVQQAQPSYLGRVWHETLGFTGAEMIRRIVGVAHVEDLESIAEVEQRGVAESRALRLARELLVASHQERLTEIGASNVTQLVTLAKSYFTA
jgi:5-methylthioribose kinase